VRTGWCMNIQQQPSGILVNNNQRLPSRFIACLTGAAFL
jgi:hypothetical protein